MKPVNVAEELVGAVRVFARHRIGAVILWDPASEITNGVLVDAVVSRDLLIALAIPEYLNRLHRGAIVVRGDRVERAAVQLSWTDVVERAASVAIMVDDSSGEIWIADRTGRVGVVDPDDLADVLRRHAREADRR